MTASGMPTRDGARRSWRPDFAVHRRLVRLLLWTALLLAAVVAGAGWFGYFGILFFFSVLSFVPGMLFSLIFTALGWRARSMFLSYLGAVAAAIVLFLVLLIPATLAGYALAKIQIQHSMRQTEAIAARLDAYRDRHGVYPATLEELAASGSAFDVPLLAREGFYTVSGDRKSCGFHFPDPTGWAFDEFSFSSDSRKWVRFH